MSCSVRTIPCAISRFEVRVSDIGYQISGITRVIPEHASASQKSKIITCRRTCSQFKNNYSTEMCSGSEEGSYLRLIDFVYHSTLGLRVIKKKKKSHARGDELVVQPSLRWWFDCQIDLF